MAIVVTLGVSTTSTVNTTTYASAAFTPAAGDGLIAFVYAGATVDPGSMTDTQSLGWERIASVNNAGDTLYCFRALNPAAASSMTVTFNCTGDGADGCCIYVARITGHDGGVPYVRQVATATGALSTTPAVPMSLAFNTNNGGLGAVGNSANPAAITPPTSWTETNGADTGYSTPTTGMEACNRVSGETGSTITWGAASASAWGAIAVELYAAGQGIIPLDDVGASGFFGQEGGR